VYEPTCRRRAVQLHPFPHRDPGPHRP